MSDKNWVNWLVIAGYLTFLVGCYVWGYFFGLKLLGFV